MKQGQTSWTREELILAINLYCKVPFGKLHSRNPKIIDLAKLINRTPGSVSFKLVNFASLDPTLKARGIKGAENASKLDKQIWNEFYNNWDEALIESEKLFAKKKHTTIEKLVELESDGSFKEGKEKERLVMTRVNQSIFRTLMLATYNNSCCITGINAPELLIASHIVPWSTDKKNRLNPMNGILLNALHDKAFDASLITIGADDYKLKVSSKLKTKNTPEAIKQSFLFFEDKEINLPDKFLPNPEYLKHHNGRFKS